MNNIVTAVSFGMTLGVTLSVAKHGMLSGQNFREVISRDMQDLGIQFIMSTTGPFLYLEPMENTYV